MENVFLHLFNMSITAGWLVLAVVVLRLLLKKAPKWLTCLLWVLVAVRLVCPFSIESVLSLIPSAETVPPDTFFYETPVIDSGVPVVDSVINPVLSGSLAPTPMNSVNPTQVLTFIAALVWVAGMVVMAIYALVSTLRLRYKVRESVQLERNIRQCDHIATPFILGVFRPRIYLPSSLDGAAMVSVVAHEEAHLKRRDHWWKPLGFLLLTVYWFNPLLWVAYILLCRDIEAACDEKVVRDMDAHQRKAYSEALLSCSAPRRLVSACPLAFGETGVKARIKSVLHYKKPAFWIVIAAAVAVIVAAVCLLTNPKTEMPEDLDSYISQVILEHNKGKESRFDFACEAHTVFGTEQKGDHTYVYCAVLYEEYVLDTSGNLKDAGGSHIPTIITVKERAGGGYEMVEYWTPRDGSLYAPDIRERFPLRYQGKALDINAYYAEHHASCLAQARERFGLVPIYSESKYTAYSYAGPPNAHFYLDPEGDACHLIASPLSSALGVGTYYARGDSLFLTYEDGIFTFHREGKAYVFDAEASTADMSLLTFGGQTVPDGAVFHPVIDRRTEYFEPLVTVSGMSHLPEDKREALYKDVPSGNLPVLALTSPAEVDAFLAEYGDLLNFDPEWDAATPRERLEGLDDAFFADYSVLAVYYSAGSCSVTPQIVNLSYYKEQGRESILLAEVDVYEPQSGDAALGQWFMLAKVDKAAIKNADTVQAQVRQTIPEDYYFQAFTQPVRDLSKANPMSRWRLSDADQHQLQQMVDRLKWMDDALLDRNLQYDACFRLGDGVTYYLDMQGEVLYDGSRVASLAQEDIDFFDLRLRLSGSASAVQAHVTGTMMGWNKAEDYLLLKVTQSDRDLGDTVKVYTRFYVGSVPSDGATVTVGYDGWPVEGDPMEVYAITMEMSGYADLEGGPDDDDDGVFTGKVLQVAGDKMLMQCYDKDKFNQVWVYFAYYYPELNPRVGDEYRIMHSDLVASSNPPQVTAENITPLSSKKISASEAQAIIESRLPKPSKKYYFEDCGVEEVEGRDYHRFRVYTRGTQPIDDDGTYMYFTYAWAYVDTQTGTLYEYDIGKMELIPWDKDKPTTTTSGTTATTTTTTLGTTASTTPTTTVPDVIVFNTENVRRVTFYSHYGAVKVRDVPAEDKAEVLNWLGTFRIKERVDDPLHLNGANTYYVEIEYSDGAIIKKGLDAVVVDGELYHITHSADFYYGLDMIWGKKSTSTSTTTTTTTTTTASTTRTTASTTTMTVPDVTVFNTENIHRITFYYKYGEEKVRDVPADDKTEVINWLKTFTFEKMVDDLMPPGTNTYYVEIEYLDGTIVKEGLDAVVVDGELYYVEHGADSYYELDMIWGKGGTATFTDP